MRKPQNWIAVLGLLLALIACKPSGQNVAPAAPTTAAGQLAPTLEPPTPITLIVTPVDQGAPPDTTLTMAPPTSTTNPASTLEGFKQLLTDGIDTRNYQYLLYAMDDPFTMTTWNSPGTAIPADKAIDQIQNDLLPPENTILYDDEKDLTALLGGKTPAEAFSPNANVVNAFFSSGWGKDGKGEAILVINLSHNNVYGWYAMIYAAQGFK